jgi:hypothetical protein
MSDYRPDKWVVVKISSDKHPTIYKVFACWYGGYLGSDSWKLNSGITKVTLEGNVFAFDGSSGSVYECHKDVYGTNMYGGGVLDDFITRAKEQGITMEVMPEKTDWFKLQYE